MAALPDVKEDVTKALTEAAKSGRASRALRNLLDASDPTFRVEYRRQMAVTAEHDRQTNFADRIEPEEEDLKGWV